MKQLLDNVYDFITDSWIWILTIVMVLASIISGCYCLYKIWDL